MKDLSCLFTDNNWSKIDKGDTIVYTMSGYELEYFEIITLPSNIFVVKVPLKHAKCIYRVKFNCYDDAHRFIENHFTEHFM